MREVTCPNCKHVQKTKTKLLSVTCSSCLRNYRIDKQYKAQPEETKPIEKSLDYNPNNKEAIKLD